MKHLPLGILITLFVLLGHCTPLQAQNSDTTSNVDCPPISLPLSENFDTIPAVNYNATNGRLPNCWHGYWNGTNIKYRPHVINDYYQNTNIQSYVRNNNALALQAGTSNGYDSIAIVETPAFGVPLAGNNLLSFYCMYEDNRGQLSVGYMQNDSFVSIAEIEPQTAGRTEYVGLDGLPADVDRIAFKWRYVGNDWYGVILDNILVYDPIMPMVHFASNWTSYTGFATTISAQLVEGSTEGLSFSWHSSLMDTTIVTMDSILNLFYNVGGFDTITLVVTNAFGSTTASAVVNVFNCTTIDSLPWTEDFNTTSAVNYNAVNGRLANCWQSYWNGTNGILAPHVVNDHIKHTNIWYYVRDNRALLLQAGTSVGYDSIAIVETSAFGVPLAGYKLSFYYMYEVYRGQLSVGYMQNDSFVSLAEIEPQTMGRTEYVTLDGIPADANRIAFKWRYVGSGSYGVILDSIRIAEPDRLPMVRFALNHWVAYASDTTTFSAQLLDGSTDNLRFSWHSSLMDTTIVTMDPVLNIVYNVGGCDTLTLVATNAYGNDTALAVVTAIDCPPIDSLPWTEDFETTPTSYYDAPNGNNGKLPNCWYGYRIGSSTVYAPIVISYFIDMLSSQALLMMAAANTSGFGTVEQVVLPRFSQPSQELAIAFDYLFEYIDKGTLTVGYIDRNNTFVAIADMTPHADSYHRDTVLLGAIPYSNVSIALRWQCSRGFHAVAIDNIKVFEVPFTRTVTVSANVDGICEPYGSGRYLDSSTVEIGYNILDTIAEGGYWRFQGWSDGGTGNPRQILVVSDTTIVSLFEWVPTQGISNVSTQTINIYPNPASGKVTVELVNTSVATVSLIDMNGRALSSYSFQSPVSSFDVSTLPSGIYFVKVASQTGIAISKLVVKH